MTRETDDRATIRCADFFIGKPRLGLILGSAERAIIVAHVAYRQAEAGGWFAAGIKGWLWLMPWRDERSIQRDFGWLIENGWLEKQEIPGKRSQWRLGPRSLEFETTDPRQNVTPNPRHSVTPTPDKLSANPRQNVTPDNTGKDSGRSLNKALPTNSSLEAERKSAACDLISDFYRRWFGHDFKQPSSTLNEMTLAAEIVDGCDGDIERAKTMQRSVIESLRKSFPAAERFGAAEVAWRKKLSGHSNEAEAERRRAIKTAEREREAERRQSDPDNSKAVYARTLPRWNRLSDEARKNFKQTLPGPIRENEFFVVVAFADSLEKHG